MADPLVHNLPTIDRWLPTPTLREMAFYFAGDIAARNVCGEVCPPCEIVADIAARVIHGDAVSPQEERRLQDEVNRRHERSIELQQRRRLIANHWQPVTV